MEETRAAGVRLSPFRWPLVVRVRSWSCRIWRSLASMISEQPPGTSGQTVCWVKVVSDVCSRGGLMRIRSRLLNPGLEWWLLWRDWTKKVSKVTRNGWWVQHCLYIDVFDFPKVFRLQCTSADLDFLPQIQTEINYLGQLYHPNLVKLVGYCLEDEHRLLVYEFMPRGSLENHLFRSKSFDEISLLSNSRDLSVAWAYIYILVNSFRDFPFPAIILEPTDEGGSRCS